MTRWIYLLISFVLFSLLSNQCFAQHRHEYKSDRILVRFSDTRPDMPDIKMNSNDKTQVLGSVDVGSVQEEFDLVPGLSVVKLHQGQNVEDAIKKLNETKGVIYAQPDYKVEVLSTSPADPRFAEQWSLNNTGQSGGTVGADIEATHAWDIAIGSRNDIIVAVIDTGIDYTHPDLAANMWVNEAELNGLPGVDDDHNGYIDDIYGYDFCNNDGDPKDDFFHGTHCAGIIGAVGNNNIGVTGVCWNVKLMAVKFLDSGGSGYTSNAIKCVQYAVKMGAKVLSNSWGGGGYDTALRDAINAAAEKNVLFIAAAGNSAGNNDVNPAYPATYDCNNIISVLSTDRLDAISSFSCYGQTTVDIGAPGSNILNTFPTYQTAAMTSYGLSTNYATISGTSMATPHVSGACALVWSQNPLLTAADVKNIIMSSVDPIPALSTKCVSGGRLNIFKAIQQVQVGAYLAFDRKGYNCQDNIVIHLADEQLNGIATQNVTLVTDSGDSETLTLQTTDPNLPIGAFSGTIATENASASASDGALQVTDGDTITVIYNDADDGDGNPVTIEETASIDCVPPSATDINTVATPCDISISIRTDKPATVTVYCTKNGCSSPTYEITKSDFILSSTHTIDITTSFAYNTNYYFFVEITDDSGNTAIADNNGNCYRFHTPTFPFSGSGTASDPYQIKTAAQLNQIGLLPCKWNKCFKLFADISMASQRNYNVIGKASTDMPFTGIFDGGNHKVSYLTYKTSNTDGAGLFGYIYYPGEVKNLAMLSVDINALTYAGGLVGYNYYGKITNSYTTGNVKGQSSTGGLAGYDVAGIITKCYSTAKVTGYGGGNYTGGLVGYDYYGTFSGCYSTATVNGVSNTGGFIGYAYYSSITSCYSTGSVTGSSYNTGGLIGRTLFTPVKKCYSTGAVTGSTDYTGGLIGLNYYGDIQNSYSKSVVKGFYSAGGLIGCNYLSNVSKCYATGSAAIPTNGTVAGGLIGYDYNSVTTDCYAQGKVTGQWYIGGLAGYSYTSTQKNCYSIGVVSGKAGYVGGLIGVKEGGQNTACYWNTQTSGQTKSAAGTGYTTAYMMNKAKYIGWNFTTIWNMVKNGSTYPTLR
jgi:subtilisin family serine protease